MKCNAIIVVQLRKSDQNATEVSGSTHVLSIQRAEITSGTLLGCTARNCDNVPSGAKHGLRLHLPERQLDLQGSSEKEASRAFASYAFKIIMNKMASVHPR